MATYPFSDELRDLKIEAAIGKTIVCEDGEPRRVMEIVTSMAYPWKAVVNENDPASKLGYFVNVYSLAHQLLHNRVPSLASQKHFEKAMRVRFGLVDTDTRRLAR